MEILEMFFSIFFGPYDDKSRQNSISKILGRKYD
jgi:hypothetical protein